MKPQKILLFILTFLLTSYETRAAQPFNVTLLTGWQNRARIDQWSPIEITVSSQMDKTFIGHIQVSIPQDVQHRMTIQRPIVILPEQSIKIPIVAKMSFSSDTCEIRMVDRDGNLFFRQNYDLFDFRRQAGNLVLISPRQVIISAAGKSAGEVALPDNVTKNERFFICHSLLQSLPYVWTGYSSLDVLILCDPDWSQINQAQDQAIAQWISNGGKVIIYLGANIIPQNSALRKLIPLKIDPPVRTKIDSDLFQKYNIDKEEPVELAAWQFQTDMPAGWKTIEKDSSDRPMQITGQAGFGQIIINAFTPSQLELNSRFDTENFWLAQAKLMIDPAIFRETEAEKQMGGFQGGYNYNYYMWNQEDNSGLNNVLSYLLSISQMRPISIFWILGILGVLAIIIGPVDYVVLKKLNRLPWTYLTFITVLTVFTLGAYFGVQYIRAGNNQFRRVCILDKIDGAPHCWQTGYTGIFASRSDDYALAGLSGDSWWSGITPTQQGYYGYNQGSGIKNVIECFQQEGNVPVSLPINIWSMRTLLDEQPTAKFPLSAKVSFDGDTLKASVTNLSDTPINSAEILFEHKRWQLGFIGPRRTTEFKTDISQYSNYNSGRPDYNDFTTAKGTVQRTKAIDKYLTNGSAVILGFIDQNAPCPLTIKDKKSDVTSKLYIRLVIPEVQKIGSNKL